MKQLIVMVSMIMLGIAISGMVSQFGDTAQTMTTKSIANLDTVVAQLDSGAING